MKLRIKVIRHREEVCEVEVPSLDRAKGIIEALRPDDFQAVDAYYDLAIFDEQGEEVTEIIQPFTPHLDV